MTKTLVGEPARTIPKTIHYIWFGGNPLPPLATHCIESWRRYMPDYKIVRWDESNFDVSCCDYVREAVEAKKWAFASDYARFKILYENGGIYLDTDVELLKPLDEIIEKGPFMGFEENCGTATGAAVAPGLGLAANPGLGLYKTILDSYERDHFIRDDGALDLTTVVTRTTAILREMGLEEKPGIQNVAGVTIYPKEYFCPKDFLTHKVTITENTYAIHHFDGSWLSPADQEIAACKYRIIERHPRISPKLAAAIAKTAYGFAHRDFSPLFDGIKRNIG